MSGSIPFRQIPQRDAAALKHAATELVERAGGVRAAAEALGTSASRVSEAASPHHPGRWFSVLQIAELECLVGEAVVTRTLARLSGLDVQVTGPAARAQWPSLLASIISECGDVESGLVMALADGHVNPREAQDLDRQIHEAMTALAGLRQKLGAAP